MQAFKTDVWVRMMDDEHIENKSVLSPEIRTPTYKYEITSRARRPTFIKTR